MAEKKLTERSIDWIQWGRRHYYLGPLMLSSKTSLRLHVSHLRPMIPTSLKCYTKIYRTDFAKDKIERLFLNQQNPLDYGDTKYLDQFQNKVLTQIKNPDIIYTLANGFEIMPNIEAKTKIHDQVACHVWLAEIQNKFSNMNINLNLLMEREQKLFKSVDLVVCPSDNVEKYVKSICSTTKTKIIRFPIRKISTNEFIKNKTSEFNVLFVGRIEIAKGINTVINLAKIFPQITFHCVGRILINVNSLPNNIKLHGIISHDKVHKFYINADLFLFPSLSEGSATVTQEAMAYGLPGLVSYQSGSHYVHNESGFVLDASDFDGFLSCLSRLEKDRSFLLKLRSAVGMRANIYTEKLYLSELYNTICETS